MADLCLLGLVGFGLVSNVFLFHFYRLFLSEWTFTVFVNFSSNSLLRVSEAAKMDRANTKATNSNYMALVLLFEVGNQGFSLWKRVLEQFKS